MSCGCGPKCSPDYDPEREGVSADDMHAFDHDGQRCPSCGNELYADADVCSFCGDAIHAKADSTKAPWVIITAGVVVVAFVLTIVL